EVGVVLNLDAGWDLGLRQAAGVDYGLFAVDLLPFEALLVAVAVEALTVLAGDVEQAARHLGADIAVAQLERRGLDGERAAVFRNQLLIDAAGTVADDALGVLAQDGQARADAVRGVVHGRKSFPVTGPAFHV